MQSYIFLPFLLLLLTRCSGQVGTDNSSTYKIFEIKVDTSQKSLAGYKRWENDEDIGVKSICLHGNSILLVDTYHSNLKKIDLLTDTVYSSVSIAQRPCYQSGVWLRDVCVFHDKVYVTSDFGKIYIFSLAKLDLIDTITIEKGQKYFYKVTESNVQVLNGMKQLPNNSIQYNILSINENDSVVNINDIKSLKAYQSGVETNRFGEIFEIETKENGDYLVFNGENKLLNRRYEEISTYSARNIDVVDDSVAYFSYNSSYDKLFIYYQKW